MDMSGDAADDRIIDHCVRGRDKLIHAYHGIFEGWAAQKQFSATQQCNSKPICAHNKLLASQSIFLGADGNIHSLILRNTANFQLCKHCLDSLVVAHDKAREELWGRLPSFFGLPPWDKLEDFDFNTHNSSGT